MPRRLKPARETRPLTSLKPHQLQEQYYDQVTEQEDRELDADLRRHGQRDAIVILPDGTILDGHRRAASLRRLKRKEAKVLVRHDLANASDATIEQAFLAFNQTRRHLDPLKRAQIALRMLELEQERRPGSGADLPEARERVGAVLGIKGRTVSRYLRVLRTPCEVQGALRQQRLPLVLAEKVADLPEEQQKKIARRIRAGEKPKTVVQSYLAPQTSKHVKVADAVASLIRSIRRGQEDLADRLESVRPGHVRKYRQELRQARRLIKQLLALAEPD